MNHNLFSLAPKIFILGFLFLGFSSCSNQVSDDLLDYINKQLPKVADNESKAVESYESVSGENYTDDESMYYEIRDEVVPVYRKFIDQLELISEELETEEVQKVHEKYIEAANVQYAAFMLILSALDHQDYNEMAEANEKLDKGRKLMREYKSDLKKICKENNVDLK